MGPKRGNQEVNEEAGPNLQTTIAPRKHAFFFVSIQEFKAISPARMSIAVATPRNEKGRLSR
jgi:hypothetical protein